MSKISNGVNIAKIIDHTNIRVNATAEDIKRTCGEARKYNFRGVDVKPDWVSLVKKEVYQKQKAIKKKDLEIFHLVDSAEEAFEIIKSSRP